MTPTEDKPKRTPKEKPQSLSIFVSRDRLALIMAVRTPSESQQETLRAAIIHKWPKVYEMRISDELTAVLKDIGMAWTVTKDAPRSAPE